MGAEGMQRPLASQRHLQILQDSPCSWPLTLPSEPHYLMIPSLGAARLRGSSSSTNILIDNILPGIGTRNFFPRNRVRESGARSICQRVGDQWGLPSFPASTCIPGDRTPAWGGATHGHQQSPAELGSK